MNEIPLHSKVLYKDWVGGSKSLINREFELSTDPQEAGSKVWVRQFLYLVLGAGIYQGHKIQ